jgi:hypothetical protein
MGMHLCQPRQVLLEVAFLVELVELQADAELNFQFDLMGRRE